MKTKFTFCLIFFTQFVFAQPPIDSWKLNTTGVTGKYYEVIGGVPTGNFIDTGSPADVQEVCYSTDSIWISSSGLAQLMGPYYNPGAPTAQDYIWRFPRNPQEQLATKTITPIVFAVGVLINGIPIYGNSNAFSYKNSTSANANNGDGIWNCEAYYNEKVAIDTAYGAHPQQQGAYHTHATPHKLYSDGTSIHSPIVGWAFDGFPIYGPFGYAVANDSTSGVLRMNSSYQLRSITQRHTLADGTVLASNQYGPDVNSTFPLGMYIEDYEFINSLGDLDEYNGRTCVTPEFPSGTYAYFVASKSDRTPKFPNYIGSKYYGVVAQDNLIPNNNITIPTSASCLSTSLKNPESKSEIIFYPNPFSHSATIKISNLHFSNCNFSMVDLLGREVKNLTLNPSLNGEELLFRLERGNLPNGIYFYKITNEKKEVIGNGKIMVE